MPAKPWKTEGMLLLAFLTFIVILLLGYLHLTFFEYRILNDASIELFFIANKKTTYIPMDRYSHLLTQIFPVIGAKVGLPLNWVAYLYGLNEFLFLIFPVLLAIKLRNTGILFAVLLGLIVCPGKDFLSLGMEIIYSAGLISLWLLWYRSTSRATIPFIIGHSVISFFIIYSHLLTIPAFVLAASYYMIYSNNVKKFLSSTSGSVAIALFLILFGFRMFRLNFYDINILNDYNNSSILNLKSMLHAFIKVYDLNTLGWLLPLLVITIILLLFSKMNKSSLFLAISAIAYPVMFLIFLGKESFDIITTYEPQKYLYPLLFLILLALSLQLEFYWVNKTIKARVLIMVFILAICFSQVLKIKSSAGLQKVKMRNELLKTLINSSLKQEGNKFYFPCDSLPGKIEFRCDYVNTESLILSNFYKTGKTSAIAFASPSYIKHLETLPDSILYLQFHWILPISSLNPNYFRINKEAYKLLEVKKSELDSYFNDFANLR